MDDLDTKAAAAIGAAGLAATALGVVEIATITAPAWGILGWIGLTTTTVVAAPVSGLVIGAGALAWGVYKVKRVLEDT